MLLWDVLVHVPPWSGLIPGQAPPASPKSLDLFANQFNICEAEIIIVTYFTGGVDED